LVAILDADKEGFLRSPRSLIQTIGRAARNANGQVIMYADRKTEAMAHAIAETERRRAIQLAYNANHGITPATVRRAIFDINPATGESDYYAVPKVNPKLLAVAEPNDPEVLEALRQQMFAAAEALDFEKAARFRDEIARLGGEAGAKAAKTTATPPKRKSRSPASKSKRR